ncbi:hypothetical protein K3725_13470 [Leisingera sp. S132]|uniref:hypothetical protein n=1 Tax=Leisingera sp. S132 TaxID=2867016 RepID=UPI0021A54CC4|nr:hypothetical protein [Leisingera sp. S132]UWQ78319.1 hypothetical protein K3725_13470 [Leisingera sp. S132]
MQKLQASQNHQAASSQRSSTRQGSQTASIASNQRDFSQPRLKDTKPAILPAPAHSAAHPAVCQARARQVSPPAFASREGQSF